MDSIKKSSSNSNVVGLVRRFAKALRFRAPGIAPEDRIRKIKYQEKPKRGASINGKTGFLRLVEEDDQEKLRRRAEIEALMATLFAGISSIKAAYAQIQIAQSPYDPDTIQSADEIVVDELKRLSELKLRCLKKEIDPNPQVTVLLAEIQEQSSLLKTYEIMGKKLESQLKIKDSEITLLREKLKELDDQNSLVESKLDSNGSPSILQNLHLSGLNSNHFATFLQHTIKSIRTFVDSMIHEMKSSGWDLAAAAQSIDPSVVYRRAHHRSFAFQSFVCREMFDGFQYPKFSPPNKSGDHQKQKPKRDFYDIFTKFKPITPRELLLQNPSSSFAKFCRAKYLRLVHSKMEQSFFGDLSQRNLVSSGGYPETSFFAAFAEMAKRLWLLHCLAFSFEPKASIFQVRKGCRFSEVFMENIASSSSSSLSSEEQEEGEAMEDSTMENPRVGLMVIPGFEIDKTVVQCQVYLSAAGNRESH